MSKSYSAKEVAEHTSDKSAWIIVEGNVYDVTEFISEHPGGAKILLKACGKDSTEMFWRFHSKKILNKTAKPYLIGAVQEMAKL